MKTHLLSFIDALRVAGLPITVAESLDAMRAVGAVGIERAAFQAGLAATLVKDQADRPVFDSVFEHFFAMPIPRRHKGDRRRNGAGQGMGLGLRGAHHRRDPKEEPQPRKSTGVRFSEQRREEHRPNPQEESRGERLARERRLQTIPFQEMSAHEVEQCEVLMAELARRLRTTLRRRQRSTQRGRLDVRRTLRRSISNGGVPIDPAFRYRQPGRPDLVALADCSHSVTTASHFLLALLAPASEFFRRTRLFAFVDQPVEVSVEGGVLVPHGALDLYARSDLGAVLVTLWQRHARLFTRNTILLVLGDARNNRRPPRADVLGRIHHEVRQVVWLNPESPARWNTGDSVLRAYARYCDGLLAAATLRELYAALRDTLSGRRATGRALGVVRPSRTVRT